MEVVIRTVASLLLVQVVLVYSWDTPRFAMPGQFPHQISLMWTLPPEIPLIHSCSGSILNKFWVLTSGYCISNIPNLGVTYVKAGVHNISMDDEYVQKREIDRTIIHEKYPGVHTLANLALYDIALIRVKVEFTFNDRVQPIQLPKVGGWLSSSHKLSYNMVLSGWGSRAYGAVPDHPDILRTVNVPVVNNKVCTDSIKTIFPNFEMNDTQMCTRPLDGSVAACIGDYGGPLIQIENRKSPVLVGIGTWTSEPCNSNGMPPIYTRVTSYVKWIEKNMNETLKKNYIL